MGETHVATERRSADHHHGESETAIYVVSGHPRFVFLKDGVETGDRDESGRLCICAALRTPHQEENPSADEDAIVVIARSTQEAIVVNLPSLAGEAWRITAPR